MQTRTTDHFDLDDLESKLEYEFRDRDLLKQALRHGTWVNQNGGGPSYQRLEFLGDAVLQLVATDFMFDQYPNHDEGGLCENRTPVIKDDACLAVAEQIGLERHIMLGKGAGEGAEHSGRCHGGGTRSGLQGQRPGTCPSADPAVVGAARARSLVSARQCAGRRAPTDTGFQRTAYMTVGGGSSTTIRFLLSSSLGRSGSRR